MNSSKKNLPDKWYLTVDIPEGEICVHDKSGRIIADVCFDSGDFTSEQAIAHGHLIKAAPEMHRALHQLSGKALLTSTESTVIGNALKSARGEE